MDFDHPPDPGSSFSGGAEDQGFDDTMDVDSPSRIAKTTSSRSPHDVAEDSNLIKEEAADGSVSMQESDTTADSEQNAPALIPEASHTPVPSTEAPDEAECRTGETSLMHENDVKQEVKTEDEPELSPPKNHANNKDKAPEDNSRVQSVDLTGDTDSEAEIDLTGQDSDEDDDFEFISSRALSPGKPEGSSMQAEDVEMQDGLESDDQRAPFVSGDENENGSGGDSDGLFVAGEDPADDNGAGPSRSKFKEPKKKQSRRGPAKMPSDYHERQHDDARKNGRTKTVWPRVGEHMRSGVKKNTNRKSSNKQARGTDVQQLLLAQYATHDFAPQNEEEDVDGDELDDLDPSLASILKTTKKDRFTQLLANSADIDLRRTKATIKDLKELCKSFGLGRMKAVGKRHWQLKGMTAVIPHHQMMGAAWMAKQELSRNGPRGGLLADTMASYNGLGKTVQIITLCVANPPPPSTPSEQRQILIIVPPGILEQWENEIENMAGDVFKRVMIYKSSDKIKAVYIDDSDIILTSYAQVFKSCPFPDRKSLAWLRKQNRHDEANGLPEWIESHIQEGGLLHNRYWYRIVVDEFHIAKNHASKISLALNALKGKYRWAVTGTPIWNRLEELFPYFRFLKDDSVTEDYETFKNKYCDPKNKPGIKKLAKKVERISLRRTMFDRILGRRILKLPRATVETIGVKFTAQERILYRDVEERFRELINESLPELDERRNLTFLVSQLTRIRQLVTHPALIDREIKAIFTLEELKKLMKKFAEVGHELADRAKGWIKEKALEPRPTAEELAAEKNVLVCEVCRDIPEDPHIIDKKNCKHLFCETCIWGAVQVQIGGGAEGPSCPECEGPFQETDIKAVPDQKRFKKHVKVMTKTLKGRDSSGFIPASLETKWLEDHDAGKVSFLPSAKLTAVVEKTKEWLRAAPDDKIIIFAQFRMAQAIIGRELGKLGVGFLYYSGDMDLKQRNKAVKEMKENPNLKVLVAGLKCGGQGLNLTFANRIISVDLWWNSAIEAQAFGRAYRMGQLKETHFVRFVIRGSVDGRLRKYKLIAEGLNEQDLSPEQALGLFGRVVKDADGHVIRVEADYEDDDENDAMGGLGGT
ncbi:uncharacterized protein LY89DRAFT_727977 [Mollisia scopiformis]|uniref:Uncharacterized protein n=1 Tax=Mollisia scopiformis TaxID=149040 RepID=A0A194XSN4_MOLSC|nr:uncharacterized protein LY89DRAFT_727977 [Mollisia scopiformis]KUJ23208.1 hypothetical protein LY89DRAFT_727977 [Mollisia scopiformis]